MADVTSCRVITIGFPGMGGRYDDPHNTLSSVDIEEAKQGRFTSLAERIWRALEQDGGELLRERRRLLPVALWLSSLSTLTGSELLATTPDNITMSDVYMAEPMALRRMRLFDFIAMYVMKSSRYFNEYGKMNQGINNAIAPLWSQIPRQAKSHYYAARALACGQQIAILREAILCETPAITDGTIFHVVRASEGLVRQKDYDALVRCLELALSERFGTESGNTVRTQVLQGEGHGLQDSLPVLRAMLDELAIIRR